MKLRAPLPVKCRRISPHRKKSASRASRKITPAALDAYLLGRHHWDLFTEESLLKSIEYFEQATRLDSGYAAAYSGIAEAWSGLFFMGARPFDEAIPKARQSAIQGSCA